MTSLNFNASPMAQRVDVTTRMCDRTSRRSIQKFLFLLARRREANLCHTGYETMEDVARLKNENGKHM